MTAYVSYLNTKDTPSTSILDGGLTTQISSYVVATSMQSLSTSFVKYSMTFSVPSGASNGILFRICLGNGLGDIASATGDLLSIGEVMLNIGTSAAPFKRAGGTIGGELSLCQRYYEKSYSVDTAPGTSPNVVGSTAYSPSIANLIFPVRFSVVKRVTPSSIIVYSPATGAPNTIRNESAGSELAIGTSQSGPGGFSFYQGAAAGTIGYQYSGHWAADAEL
jgi:hypothetical protein